MAELIQVNFKLERPDDYDTYFLYVMKCGPYFKVGISNDVEARLRELRVGNPFKITPVKVVDVRKAFVRRMESHLHEALKQFRHRGEWFSADLTAINTAIREARAHLSVWMEEYVREARRPEPIPEPLTDAERRACEIGAEAKLRSLRAKNKRLMKHRLERISA